MALDPSILAALSAGAKTSNTAQDWEQWRSSTGERKGAWNLGQSIIDILATGGYATAGLTQRIGQGVAEAQRGDVGGAIASLNPFGLLAGTVEGVTNRRTYSDNLKDLGVDDTTATWLGLALDIGLDPTTYITGGTLAGVKGAVQAGKGISKLDDSQKMGNLLSGIASGYNKGKANYKVTTTERKLNRLTKDPARARTQAKLDERIKKAGEIVTPVEISAGLPKPGATALRVATASGKLEGELDLAPALTREEAAAPTVTERIVAKEEKVAKPQKESPDEAGLLAQETKDTLAAQAKTIKDLNNFVKGIVKPGAAVADIGAFNKSKSTFLQKVSKVSGKEVASLKTASGEIMAVSAADLNRYVVRPGLIAGAKADLYEKILSAPAIIPEALTSLRSKVGATPTIDDLVYLISDRATASVIREQAISAFEASKSAMQVAETSLPANRSWVEGIVSADDAGDAARGLIDWIYPSLRKSNATAYKAIAEAVEKALEKKLKAASKNTLSADQVEKIVADFIENDLAKIVNNIKATDIAKLIGDGNTYADLADFTAALQSGRQTLTKEMKDALANILGVPVRSSKKSLVEAINNVDTGLLAAIPGAEATAVTKGATKLENAIEAAGISGASEIAAKIDAITGGDPAALPVAVNTFAENSAREFVAHVSQFPQTFLTAVFDLLKGKKGLYNRASEQIETLAEKAGLSREEVFAELASGRIGIVTDFAKEFSPEGAVRLKELGSEGLIDIYNAAFDLKGYKSKGKKELQAAAEKERDLLLAATLFFRAAGVPVRSIETAFGAILRAGKDTPPARSSTTFVDIFDLLLKQNPDLAIELRKVRGTPKMAGKYGYGNFLPTQIEEAWLRADEILSAMKPEDLQNIAKGSDKWNEIRKALDNRIAREEGKLVQKPANHVLYAESSAAAKASIEKTSDDFVDFIIKNHAVLKELSNGREALIEAAYGAEISTRVSSIMSRLIDYGTQINRFKAIAREARKGTPGEKIEVEFAANMQTITADIANLLNELKSVYGDPDLALSMYGHFKSSLLNPGTRGGIAQTNSVLRNLWREMDNNVAVSTAMESVPKNARNSQKAVPSRTKELAKVRDQESAIAGEATVGKAVPGAEEVSETSQEIANLTVNAMANPQGRLRNLALAFNGSYVMGPLVKAFLNAKEHRVFSWLRLDSLVIKEYSRRYKGKQAEVRAAFKALQEFKKEAAETAEDLVLRDWLAGRGVDSQLVEDLDIMMSNLFGDEKIFGLVKSNAIFPSELANELSKLGIGGEVITKLKMTGDDAVEIETFWHNIDVGDNDVFGLVNATMMAVNKVAANIELGNNFYRMLGRTQDELVTAGEDLAQWGRINVEESGFIGKLIGDTEKLFHVDDIKRLSAAERYLQSTETLSVGALQNIVDISDRMTYVLKSTQTLIRPGHWVVSFVGEAAMNALAGVGLRHYHKGTRILGKFRPGNYDNTGDPMRSLAELQATKGFRIKEDEFAEVFWNNPITGKREYLTDEDTFTLAEKLGMLISPGGSGVEDFLVSQKTLASQSYGKWHKGMNVLAVGASYRDNAFRLPHFIHELERVTGAKTLEEAAARAAAEVIRWHPTSGNLSAFEKKYMRRLVYFYTWQRTALTTVIGRVLEVPGLATVPSKIQYAFADANGFDPESFGDPWDPDGIYASWYTGQLWGPQFQGPGGDSDPWGIQPAIQPIDVIGQVFKPFTLQPGQSPIDSMMQGVNDVFSGNLNPVLKTIIESSAQSRLGEGGDLPSPTEYLINQVGLINTLSKVSGIGQDPNPYETPQEKSEKDFRLWLNLLLGQRLTDYRTPSSDYRWTVDQQEIAQRLSGR